RPFYAFMKMPISKCQQNLISKAIYASVIGMLAGAFLGVIIVGLVAAAVIVLAGSSGMVIASLESARQSPNDFAALAVASLGGGALSGIFFGIFLGASIGAQVGLLSVIADYHAKRIVFHQDAAEDYRTEKNG
ncbi:MAG: hypothetical protein OXG84_10555, partial [Chloroflexi bacterium]|nr:hypothetical protein [Chloroflexota bacterium]